MHEMGFTVATEHAWKPLVDDTASIVDSLLEDDPYLVLAVGSFEDDTHFVRELVTRDSRMIAIGVMAAGISAFVERLNETVYGVFGSKR